MTIDITGTGGVSWPGLAASLVSAQSSARPGAVIELDQVDESQQDWHNTIMLHAFQEEMVVGIGQNQQQMQVIAKKPRGSN